MIQIRSTIMQAVGLLTALLALEPRAHADVLVVDRNGGAPFTTIQAAVNAAVDGDVILVKPATQRYAAFTITNKALTVAGDPAGALVARVSGPVVVQSLAATRTVVLSSLEVGYQSTSFPPVHALHAAGIDGQLRLHKCTFTGARGAWMQGPGYGYGLGSPGGAGAWIEHCSGGVAFEACTITGGRGGNVSGTAASPGGPGGSGVESAGARVVLYDSTLRGGDGGDGSYQGGAGGNGMVSRVGAYLGQFSASNTSFVGGNGSFAEDLGCFCGPGGAGGHGLSIGAGTQGWQLECAYVGGMGGTATGTFPPGVPGQGLVNNGSLGTFQVSKVVLSAPAIVRESTAMAFTFTAEPGDEIFLARSKRTSFLGLPSWRGFFLAKPVGLNLEMVVPPPIATIPGSGQVTISVRAPEVEPATNGRTVFYQAYRMTPSGSITLGSFAAVTVVGASY